MLKKAKYIPIGLPFDDQIFNDNTASEAADRLQMLKGVGYCVPQYAIDALREEGGGKNPDLLENK